MYIADTVCRDHLKTHEKPDSEIVLVVFELEYNLAMSEDK